METDSEGTPNRGEHPYLTEPDYFKHRSNISDLLSRLTKRSDHQLEQAIEEYVAARTILLLDVSLVKQFKGKSDGTQLLVSKDKHYLT